jgi:hypothetical protein
MIWKEPIMHVIDPHEWDAGYRSHSPPPPAPAATRRKSGAGSRSSSSDHAMFLTDPRISSSGGHGGHFGHAG